MAAQCLAGLPGHDRAQVVVVGAEAHVCVMQTSLELLEDGKEVYVVADAIASRRAADRDIALTRMRDEGIRVVTREMVAFEWLGEAGTPLFRRRSSQVSSSSVSARTCRMSFLAILAALGLEQWRAFAWRASVERAFVRYARWIEREWNGGTAQHGWFALVVAIAPPVLVVEGVFLAGWLVHPAVGLVLNVVVLYFMMGFRRFSHAVSAIVNAFKANDLAEARRALAAWRGGSVSELTSEDVARLAIERGLVDAYRQVFARDLLVRDPARVRRARCSTAPWRCSRRNGDAPPPGIEPTPLTQARDEFGRPARKLLALLDWIPVRLTALSFAIVGDFEDAVACWRTQAHLWATAGRRPRHRHSAGERRRRAGRAAGRAAAGAGRRAGRARRTGHRRAGRRRTCCLPPSDWCGGR